MCLGTCLAYSKTDFQSIQETARALMTVVIPQTLVARKVDAIELDNLQSAFDARMIMTGDEYDEGSSLADSVWRWRDVGIGPAEGRLRAGPALLQLLCQRQHYKIHRMRIQSVGTVRAF